MSRPRPIAPRAGAQPAPTPAVRGASRSEPPKTAYVPPQPRQVSYQNQPSHYAPPPSQRMSQYPQQQYEQQYEETQSFEEAQPHWSSSQPPIQRPSSEQMNRHTYRPTPQDNMPYTPTSTPGPSASISARSGPKASEVLLGRMAELDAKLDANTQGISDLRQMIEAMHADLHSLPSRANIKEDLSVAVAPVLISNKLQGNLINTLQDSVRRIPTDTASFILEKVRPMLSSSSSAASATEKHLSKLMDHLLASLRPMEELRTSLQGLQSLPAALQSIPVVQRSLETLRSKVDDVAQRTLVPPPNPPAPIDDRVLNVAYRMERRLENVDRSIGGLATDAGVKDIARSMESLRDRPAPTVTTPEVDVAALASALLELQAKREAEDAEIRRRVEEQAAKEREVELAKRLEEAAEARRQAEQRRASRGLPSPPTTQDELPARATASLPAQLSTHATPTPTQLPRSTNGRFLKRRVGQPTPNHQDSLLQTVANGQLSPSASAATEAREHQATPAVSKQKGKRKGKKTPTQPSNQPTSADAPSKAAPAPRKRKPTQTNTPPAQQPSHDTPPPSKKRKTSAVPDVQFVRRSERRRSEPQRFGRTQSPELVKADSEIIDISHNNEGDSEESQTTASQEIAQLLDEEQAQLAHAAGPAGPADHADRELAGLLMALSQSSQP